MLPEEGCGLFSNASISVHHTLCQFAYEWPDLQRQDLIQHTAGDRSAGQTQPSGWSHPEQLACLPQLDNGEGELSGVCTPHYKGCAYVPMQLGWMLLEQAVKALDRSFALALTVMGGLSQELLQHRHTISIGWCTSSSS